MYVIIFIANYRFSFKYLLVIINQTITAPLDFIFYYKFKILIELDDFYIHTTI
jgi:hypothetical protein